MTDDQASDVAERLRKMIAETNRNCLLSSWLTFLDTASEVLQELTAARARLAELEAESKKNLEFANVVLSSMRWTGDGYEWTGGQYDYRVDPATATGWTLNELSRLRGLAKDCREERAAFNDPTPLTPEKVMAMLPANHKRAGLDEALYESPVATIQWFTHDAEFLFFVNGGGFNVIGFTLGRFRKLLSVLQIQIPSREEMK